MLGFLYDIDSISAKTFAALNDWHEIVFVKTEISGQKHTKKGYGSKVNDRQKTKIKNHRCTLFEHHHQEGQAVAPFAYFVIVLVVVDVTFRS